MNLVGLRNKVLGGLVFVAALASFGIALVDSDPNTVPDLDKLLIAAGGAGVMSSRQNNVTSEQAIQK